MTKDENIVAFPDLSQIEAQASEWIMLLEDGTASPEEQAAFQAWLSKSDQHREAYKRLTVLWGGMDRYEELRDYAASAEGAALLRANSRRSFLTSRRALVRIAASAVLLAGIGGSLHRAAVLGASHTATYQTAIGDRELVPLPDGSQIELNTNSRIEITYSHKRRNVRLVQGEAYFDVAKDQRRPFAVYAGDGVVEAIGTAFAVRLHANKVDVTVTQGRVALFAPEKAVPAGGSGRGASAGPKPLLQVTAGQQAVFEQEVEQLQLVEPDVIRRKLSWRDGMLVFTGDPLAEMVAEMTRYTDMAIEIDSADLRAMPVAGYFRVGDVDAMLEALELAGTVRVERLGPQHVRLTKAEGQL